MSHLTDSRNRSNEKKMFARKPRDDQTIKRRTGRLKKTLKIGLNPYQRHPREVSLGLDQDACKGTAQAAFQESAGSISGNIELKT